MPDQPDLDGGTDAQLLEEVQNLAGVGSFVWNIDDGSIRWSAKLYAITGVHPEVVPTVASFDALVHPDDAPALQAKRELFLTDGSESGHECRIIRPDGTIRTIVLRSRQSGEAPNRLVIGAIQDVTETRALEDRLKRGQVLAAVGRLAAGVAHDFNNLLSVILANGSLLELKLGKRPELTDLIRASVAGQELTQRLLAVSDGQRMPDPTVLDLNRRLETGRNLLGGVLPPQVALVIVLGTPPPVLADPRMFDQILLNLVLNAADAMGGQGTLTLRTGGSVASGRGWLEVQDTGSGMSPEVLVQATEPFFSTKSPNVGSGLGLSMVQTAIDQIGGKLELESTRGMGTTARLTFRAAPEVAHEEPPSPGEAPPGAASVLIVEDEDGVRAMAARVLSEFGYDVFEASGPVPAEAFVSRGIDLVLCDVRMPDGGGEAVLRAFSGTGVPFLFMTGYARRMPWLEAQIVLEKPFKIQALLRAVQRAIRQEK